jgi:hypothetical protein
MTPQEEDFERGHPARGDYNPRSPEALAWARAHFAPLGERDFPPGHPKACDTDGNMNQLEVLPGIDPLHPEREPFSGRTPNQVKAMRDLSFRLSKQAKDTPPTKPVFAPDPPEPIERPIPTGQPGE